MISILLCGSALLILQDATLIGDFEGPVEQHWEFGDGSEFPGAQGSFERSAEAARDGDFGGRLSFDFTGGGAYVEAAVVIPEAVTADAIELDIRKIPGNTLAIRFTDSEGQTFQKNFNVASGVWQRVRIYADRWAVNWGGPADGIFRGPISRVSLVADRSGGPAVGDVDLDNVTALKGAGRGGEGTVLTDYRVTEFEDWGFWCEGDPGATAHDGGVLTYDFSGCDAAVFSTDQSLLADPQSVRLRVRSDGSGHAVILSLGSHFQTFTKTLGTLDEVGEMAFEAPIGDMSEWLHGGGEDDGIKRLPLRATRLTIRPSGDGPDTGSIELIALEASTRLPSPREALFPVAQPGRGGVDLAVTSLAGSDLTCDVVAEFLDWQGLKLGEAALSLAVPAGGTSGIEVPYDFNLRPFVEARIRVDAPGQATARATTALVSPMDEPGTTELRPESPWGMGLYLYRYNMQPSSLAEMERAAAMASAAGVKWSREEMQWHRIETAKGEFDWEFYDRVVDTATRHGISVYGLIAYWSRWTEPYTEQGIQDYCDFAQALVRRYGDRIKHWEIWNEPNIFFWGGPDEVYFELLDRAYAAIKEVDPEAVVFGCSTAGIDIGFVERTMEAGSRFDGLTIHPYRGDLDDLGFVDELRGAAELASRDGVERPVWITEMGWSTQIGATTEREQAQYLARCYIDAIASGVVGNMGWYNFRNDGTNPYYNEHNFGVVRRDFTPKPAYRALAAVCRTLVGLEPAGPPGLDENGLLTAHFRGDERWVTACWGTKGGLTVTVDPDVTATTAMLEPVPSFSVGNNHYLAVARNTPILLESTEGPPEPAVSDVGPTVDRSRLRPGETVEVSVPLATLAGGDAQLEWSAPAHLEVSETADGAWRVTAAEDAPSGPAELTAILRMGDARLALPLTLELIPDVLEV